MSTAFYGETFATDYPPPSAATSLPPPLTLGLGSFLSPLMFSLFSLFLSLSLSLSISTKIYRYRLTSRYMYIDSIYISGQSHGRDVKRERKKERKIKKKNVLYYT